MLVAKANGLVERSNRLIQNLLLLTLSDRHENWDKCLHGVLFALRSTVQAPTKFSPFKMLYGREPVLPTDVDHEFADCTSDPDDPEFEEADFHATLSKLEILQNVVFKKADANIERAQAKQQGDFAERQYKQRNFNVGDKLLLYNLRRAERKGGK
ncbi:hypothetical protein E2C01_022380 [Portunus trituberculatus]|uniref:Integrase catalytic domain-containing protein n=1 Tax=Portunus trituberculatus TaxID=210409 RepID=A0A5B7E598_PORTR|nr:hypothetical protein [Portunus trituberculatus]